MAGGGSGPSSGSQKDLWDNMPALNILKIKRNEGVDYAKELRLLFAGTSYRTMLYLSLTPKQHLEI